MHEVVLRNRVIGLSPPLEASREVWLRHLHSVISVVCDQPRITADRYDLVLGSTNAEAAGDASIMGRPGLLARLPDGLVASAYNAVESQLQRVKPYVRRLRLWLRIGNPLTCLAVNVVPGMCHCGCGIRFCGTWKQGASRSSSVRRWTSGSCW